MARAAKGSVVLEARLGTRKSNNGNIYYPRVTMDIKKGKPVPVEGPARFYARYSDPGKGRVIEALGSNLDNAWVAAQNIELRLHAHRLGQTLPGTTPTSVEPAKEGTIDAAVTEYLKEQKARVQSWRDGSRGGLAKNSYPVIENAAKTFLMACTDFGAVDISELKDPQRGRAIMLHVLSWLSTHTVRRKRKDGTQKGKAAYSDGKKLTFISQLLAANGIKMAKDKKIRWDSDPGLLKWLEFPRARKPKVSDVVFYTPEDLKAMWDGAAEIIPAKAGENRASYTTEDLRDLLCVLCLTGMRDEEIQYLQWDDIIWANGDGLPKFKVKDKPQYDWKPKNGERIVQPIEYFAKVLRDRLKARKARKKPVSDKLLVFPTTVDTPDQNFADQIRKMQDQALKAKYQFNRPEAHEQNIIHNFRRTFATVLNSCYGLSAPTVQIRIGDADLKTVQRYLGMVDEPAAMREAFEALPFAERREN